MKTITNKKLKNLSVDTLVELLDNGSRYSNDSYMKIDRACRERVTEYNKEFKTDFNNIYQANEHYKNLN